MFKSKVKRYLKNSVHFLDIILCKLFVNSRFTSSLYYFLFSRKFDREHQSVLAGRLAYHQKSGRVALDALIRRNTHRLEKGLTMKPMRKLFAIDYIEETVSAFLNYPVSDDNRSTAMWCFDVLSEYFLQVERNDHICSLKNEFEECDNFKVIKGVAKIKRAPFMYGEKFTQTSFEDFASLASARHSTRWYMDKEVVMDEVEKCIEVASCAPSACNRQPFRYVVLNDKAKASHVAGFAMGTGGYASNITGLIVVVGDLSAYPFDRDRHVVYIDASLSSMLLMLSFKAKGIDTCPINWPDIENREKKMDRYLKLQKYERPIMLLAYGYAERDSLIPYSQKKSAEQLVMEG